VVQVGAQLKVILSTDDLFYSKSARLRVSSYPLLDKVVALLNTYDKEVMRIAAYTDDKGEFKRDQALSQMRARYLSNYMWQHGLDTRLLQMDASGQAGAIASNRSIHGRSQNRRVEITIWEILPLT
jgi:outer membrane protein OmpA-like peptidoglycan-associated protein